MLRIYYKNEVIMHIPCSSLKLLLNLNLRVNMAIVILLAILYIAKLADKSLIVTTTSNTYLSPANITVMPGTDAFTGITLEANLPIIFTSITDENDTPLSYTYNENKITLSGSASKLVLLNIINIQIKITITNYRPFTYTPSLSYNLTGLIQLSLNSSTTYSYTAHTFEISNIPIFTGPFKFQLTDSCMNDIVSTQNYNGGNALLVNISGSLYTYNVSISDNLIALSNTSIISNVKNVTAKFSMTLTTPTCKSMSSYEFIIYATSMSNSTFQIAKGSTNNLTLAEKTISINKIADSQPFAGNAMSVKFQIDTTQIYDLSVKDFTALILIDPGDLFLMSDGNFIYEGVNYVCSSSSNVDGAYECALLITYTNVITLEFTSLKAPSVSNRSFDISISIYQTDTRIVNRCYKSILSYIPKLKAYSGNQYAMKYQIPSVEEEFSFTLSRDYVPSIGRIEVIIYINNSKVAVKNATVSTYNQQVFSATVKYTNPNEYGNPYSFDVASYYSNYSEPCETWSSFITTAFINCSGTCKKCMALSSNCTECPSKSEGDNTILYIYSNYYRTCLSEACPSNNGYYLQSSTQCLQCSASCVICNSTNCIKCDNSTNLLSNQCLESCGDGYYSENRVCKNCMSHCQQCKNSSSCIRCEDGNLMFGSSCKSENECTSGYYIDRINNQCLTCTSPCKECDYYECSACIQSYFLKRGKCVDTCGAGFYISGSNCLACTDNCLTCGSSGSECTSCGTTYSILFNNTCLLDCPEEKYYLDKSTNTCQTCSYKCKKCSEKSGYCIECYSASVYPNYYSNDCVTVCPNNTLALQNICVSCNDECSRCSISVSNCTSCALNYYKYNGECLEVCPEGTYSSNATNTCNPCSSKCATCSITSENCAICSNSYYLYEGSCLSICPASTFNLANPNRCVECPSLCEYCTSKTNCSSCNSGYLLNNICTTSCPSGTYASNTTMACIACPLNCSECSNANNCSSCVDGSYLLGKKCEAECPSGMYSSDEFNECYNCSSECEQCSILANRCTKCAKKYYTYINNCLLSCPAGMYSDNLNICQNCSLDCLTCESTSSKCISCEKSKWIYQHQCFDSCQIGTYESNVSKECLSCSSKCLACSKTTTNCVECSDGLILLNNECLKECPSKTYQSSFTCLDCASECSKCISQTECTACSEGYSLNGTKCVKQCSSNTYHSSPLTCLDCASECSKCISQTECTACSDGYSLNGTKCVKQCSSNTYQSTPLTCLDCASECSKCISLTECTACNEGYSLNGTKCVKESITTNVKSTVPIPFSILLGVLLMIEYIVQLRNHNSRFIPNAIALISIILLPICIFEMMLNITSKFIFLTILIVGVGFTLFLNIIFVLLMFLKILKYDDDFASWKKHHMKINHTLSALSAVFSYNLCRFLYSMPFGFEHCTAVFKSPTTLAKPLLIASYVHTFGICIEMVGISIYSIIHYPHWSQAFSSSLDSLIVHLLFIALILKDLKDLKAGIPHNDSPATGRYSILRTLNNEVEKSVITEQEPIKKRSKSQEDKEEHNDTLSVNESIQYKAKISNQLKNSIKEISSLPQTPYFDNVYSDSTIAKDYPKPLNTQSSQTLPLHSQAILHHLYNPHINTKLNTINEIDEDVKTRDQLQGIITLNDDLSPFQEEHIKGETQENKEIPKTVVECITPDPENEASKKKFTRYQDTPINDQYTLPVTPELVIPNIITSDSLNPLGEINSIKHTPKSSKQLQQIPNKNSVDEVIVAQVIEKAKTKINMDILNVNNKHSQDINDEAKLLQYEDISGCFDKNSRGSIIINENEKGQLVDKNNRRVNKNGYLIDSQMNVITKDGTIAIHHNDLAIEADDDDIESPPKKTKKSNKSNRFSKNGKIGKDSVELSNQKQSTVTSKVEGINSNHFTVQTYESNFELNNQKPQENNPPSQYFDKNTSRVPDSESNLLNPVLPRRPPNPSDDYRSESVMKKSREKYSRNVSACKYKSKASDAAERVYKNSSMATARMWRVKSNICSDESGPSSMDNTVEKIYMQRLESSFRQKMRKKQLSKAKLAAKSKKVPYNIQDKMLSNYGCMLFNEFSELS